MEIKVIKGVKISPINQHTANMKNQDYIIQLLEKLDGKFSHLEFIVSRQEPLEVYKKTIEEGKEIIEDIKSSINR